MRSSGMLTIGRIRTPQLLLRLLRLISLCGTLLASLHARRPLHRHLHHHLQTIGSHAHLADARHLADDHLGDAHLDADAHLARLLLRSHQSSSAALVVRGSIRKPSAVLILPSTTCLSQQTRSEIEIEIEIGIEIEIEIEIVVAALRGDTSELG